jgi:hypothetical protein
MKYFTFTFRIYITDNKGYIDLNSRIVVTKSCSGSTRSEGIIQCIKEIMSLIRPLTEIEKQEGKKWVFNLDESFYTQEPKNSIGTY